MVYFDRTRNGREARRISETDLKGSVRRFTFFNFFSIFHFFLSFIGPSLLFICLFGWFFWLQLFFLKVNDEVDFHGPISGQQHVTIFGGKYQYVNLIENAASVFIVVDPSKTSKTNAMATSIARCWPILIVCICMTLLTGILIWMAVSWFAMIRCDSLWFAINRYDSLWFAMTLYDSLLLFLLIPIRSFYFRFHLLRFACHDSFDFIIFRYD